MLPKVSIIVPVYNGEKYISKCLESILNQTYINIEVVVINDGSTDRSEEVINHFEKKDSRIVYFYQNNSGPSEARNNGLSNSSGDYLVFVDSDDTVNNDYIEVLINSMISSDCDLVCCGYNDISQYGITKITDFNFDNSVSMHNMMEMVCKGTGGVLWSKIYKKEIIMMNNLKMDKNIFMSEDLIFVLQYISHCKSFASIKEYLYNYNRLNQSSISSKISMDYIENYIAVYNQVERILNSVHFDEQKKFQIISKSIQDIVINLIAQQSSNLKQTGLKNSVNNVQHLLSIPYVEKYKYKFTTSNSLYKPYVFMIKNKFIRMSIFYGLLLNGLKQYKNKLTRKKVSEL